MKNLLEKCKKNLLVIVGCVRHYGILFFPAFISAFLGLGMLFMPDALPVLAAISLMFFSVVLTYLAWKFLVAKVHIEAMLHQFKCQSIVHAMNFDDMVDFDAKDDNEKKKIIYH